MEAGVAVLVEMDVGVDVAVAVPVEATVEVDVAVTGPVEVDVCEGVAEAVGVEVGTGLGFDVEVDGNGKYTSVFVGLAKTVAVLVASAVIVA